MQHIDNPRLDEAILRGTCAALQQNIPYFERSSLSTTEREIKVGWRTYVGVIPVLHGRETYVCIHSTSRAGKLDTVLKPQDNPREITTTPSTMGGPRTIYSYVTSGGSVVKRSTKPREWISTTGELRSVVTIFTRYSQSHAHNFDEKSLVDCEFAVPRVPHPRPRPSTPPCTPLPRHHP